MYVLLHGSRLVREVLVLIYSEVHEAQESRPPRLGYIETRTHSLTHSLLAKRQRDAHLHRLARWATIRRARVVTRRMKAPLAAVRADIRLEHQPLEGYFQLSAIADAWWR